MPFFLYNNENCCLILKLLFVQALKEAIEVFYSKGVSASSSDELLATFYDNILKVGFGEKVSVMELCLF
jgi:hypothetical protein